MENIKSLKDEIFSVGVEKRGFSANISKEDSLLLLKDQYLFWTEPLLKDQPPSGSNRKEA